MAEPYLDDSNPPKIPLPSGWPEVALDALLHVIALARLAIISARNWPPDATDLNVRAKCDRLETENALLRQELAIKDAWCKRIPPHKRPHYTMTQRLEILMLKSALGLSNVQLAKRFHVTAQTIQNWLRSCRENDGLVSIPEPVTRYPTWLRYVVRQIKAMLPLLGNERIADSLGRAGLHLSASTVGRITKEPPIHPADIGMDDSPTGGGEIIAKTPDRVWGIDLTEVPIHNGFWTPWSPHAVTQRWPYCWHVLAVVDHHSRYCPGLVVFKKSPTCDEVIKALDRLFREHGSKPQDFVLDQGKQFTDGDFKEWAKAHSIHLRYGALHKHGSIAVVERLHKSMKVECIGHIMVPTDKADFEDELDAWRTWYNEHRAHRKLQGRTPEEAYFKLRAANCKPRIEPRPGVGHSTPCAAPRMMIAGKPGAQARIEITYHRGRRHLPIFHAVRV